MLRDIFSLAHHLWNQTWTPEQKALGAMLLFFALLKVAVELGVLSALASLLSFVFRSLLKRHPAGGRSSVGSCLYSRFGSDSS